MAELLVKAKPHWQDSIKQAEINKMSEGERASYNARSQIGDIIVVRPDGWPWGKCECLPDFVIIKLPNVKAEDIKHYEQPLMDTTDPRNPVVLKRRKHAVDIGTVEDCIKEVGGIKEVAKLVFDGKLIVKTSVEIKAG